MPLGSPRTRSCCPPQRHLGCLPNLEFALPSLHTRLRARPASALLLQASHAPCRQEFSAPHCPCPASAVLPAPGPGSISLPPEAFPGAPATGRSVSATCSPAAGMWLACSRVDTCTSTHAPIAAFLPRVQQPRSFGATQAWIWSVGKPSSPLYHVG